MVDDELTHHGIMGMKWGVRRFQPYPKGKGHKGTYKGKKTKHRKPTRQERVASSNKKVQKAVKAKVQDKYDKEDAKSNKILVKLKGKPIKDSTSALIKKYKADGMNDDEARVAAYKYERAKKIAIGAGAVLITSAAVYGAYKLHGHTVDKVIKAGTTMRQVTATNDKSIKDAFYASTGKMDRHKYEGLHAEAMASKGNTVYTRTVKAVSDVRQASNVNARKVLDSLTKEDKSFTREFDKILSKNRLGEEYAGRVRRAQASLRSGKVDNNVYNVFNTMLVDHSPDMQKLTDTYYSKMSKSGYNAIKDINDTKFSGFKSKNPLITFDGKGKFKVTDVRELAKEDIQRSSKIAYADIIGKELTKQGAINAGIFMGTTGISKNIETKTNNQNVKEYRKEHPNSNKSYTEIIRTLGEGG